MSKVYNELKIDPRTAHVYEDSDGAWLELKPGFAHNTEEHVLRERSLTALKRTMRSVHLCRCRQCAPPVEAQPTPKNHEETA